MSLNMSDHFWLHPSAPFGDKSKSVRRTPLPFAPSFGVGLNGLSANGLMTNALIQSIFYASFRTVSIFGLDILVLKQCGIQFGVIHQLGNKKNEDCANVQYVTQNPRKSTKPHFLSVSK